ncbi:MAG: glycine cleavage system protein H [Anaerolineae bacterium]
MTTIAGYEFPDELYYTKEHVWARVEGDVVTIGLTQFGQAIAGDIVYVEVPRAGRAVTQNEPFMSMESGKWVGRVKSPLDGTIAEANGEVEWESAVVNRDPYGEGWLAKIKATDLSQLNNLMKADSPELAALIEADRIKYKK